MAKNPNEKITVVFTRRQAEYILDMLEMFSLHTLLGHKYGSWISDYNAYTNDDEDGYDPWDEGIAP